MVKAAEQSKSSKGTEILVLSGPPPPLDMEFKATRRTERIFSKCGLSLGRCFGSKSSYRERNPRHQFIPNANVFCRTCGKVWWGDLDLASDKPKLEAAARRLRARLYVLYELNGRFERASLPFSKVVTQALWHTGGPVRIPGLSSIGLRAGLTKPDLALLLNMSRHQLMGRHEPARALKLCRDLKELGETICFWLPRSWRGKWGRWLAAPNLRLRGLSPLEKLRGGGELELGKLLNAEFPDESAS